MQQNTDNKKAQTQSLGIAMSVIAMLLALALMTWLFQDVLDKQYNPNQSINSSQSNNEFIEIHLKRNRSGHYVGTGQINNKKTVFLLDTGATLVAIPEQQMQRLGLKKGKKVQLTTANGRSIGYQTKINKLTMGNIHLYDVRAIITPNLEEILLGMSVLKQLEFTQRGDMLTIRQYL